MITMMILNIIKIIDIDIIVIKIYAINSEMERPWSLLEEAG